MILLFPEMLSFVTKSRKGSPASKLDAATAEAAQNYLGKASKMEIAHEAVMLQDLQALAQQDRRDVAMLKAKHLWKDQAPTKAEDMGDIIVCDDFHQSAPNIKSGLSALGASALTAAMIVGGGGLGLLLPGILSKPTPTATSPITIQQPATPQLDSEWDEVSYVPSEKPGDPEQILGRVRYRSRSGVVEQRQPDGSWKQVAKVPQ